MSGLSSLADVTTSTLSPDFQVIDATDVSPFRPQDDVSSDGSDTSEANDVRASDTNGYFSTQLFALYGSRLG